MDGLSGAANVIAVIGISAKVISLCSDYLKAVKDAKKDIERIQKKVSDITSVLQNIKRLLDGHDKTRLSTTHGLIESLRQCLQELEDVKVKLEPKMGRKAMSKFGVRALKWPLTSKQVDRIVSSLEGYEQTFTLALQVDQTYVPDSLHSISGQKTH
jgi:predicted  nucleic acid-binding Zn-ribbon protein